MTASNFVGFLLAVMVLGLLLKVLGPKIQVASKKKKRSKKRTVKVDPLVARERRLAAELRYVRTQLQTRDTFGE